MVTVTYDYVTTIIDGDGIAHAVTGQCKAARGDYPMAARNAMSDSFKAITGGDTTYGRPGEGGCRGPYTITKLVLKV
jgi:hypothetical protein